MVIDGDHVMVRDVIYCSRFFQNWHSPELVTSAMPTQIVVFYVCSLFAYLSYVLKIFYIMPLLRCMYTIRIAPRDRMEGLITSYFQWKGV